MSYQELKALYTIRGTGKPKDWPELCFNVLEYKEKEWNVFKHLNE